MAARTKPKPTGGYIGKAPLTVVTTTDGRHEHVYAGQQVPGHVSDEELLRLIDGKFIAEVQAPAASAPTK